MSGGFGEHVFLISNHHVQFNNTAPRIPKYFILNFLNYFLYLEYTGPETLGLGHIF